MATDGTHDDDLPSVTLVVDAYLPAPKASAQLFGDLAAVLRGRGHAVLVLTLDANVLGPVASVNESGVDVLRVRSPQLKGIPYVVRAWREHRLSTMMWRRTRRQLADRRCDLLVFYSPTIFFAGLVHRLREMWGCRTYLVLRDIFPQWARETGVMSRGPIYQYFKLMAARQYRIADTVGLQSPANLAYFMSSVYAHPRAEVLFNWRQVPREPPRPRGLRERHGLTGKVIFLFGGTFGPAQDVDNVMRLTASLQSLAPDAHFLFIGSGADSEKIRAAAAVQQNVTLLSPVSQAEYDDWLADVDVGVASLARTHQTHNFPGRLLGYMSYSLPILASTNVGNDVFSLIQASGAGLCSVNGDDGSFLRDAQALAQNSRLRSEVGNRAHALLRSKFSVETAADQVLAVLRLPALIESRIIE